MDNQEQFWVYLLDIVQRSENFVTEQAPDFVQEIILLNYITGWTDLVLSLLSLIVIFVVGKITYKILKQIEDIEELEPETFLKIIGCVVAFTAIVCWLPFALGQLHSGVYLVTKTYIAPRITVVDSIQRRM